MIILILALVLILGIAFLQMKQGMFSSLIMMVCTVLSGALAMSVYKQAAMATGLYDQMNPLLVDAAFVAVIFFLPLFGLRTFTDKYISEDIYFNVVIDRICGGICGLITGITMIGILLVVTQLLPLSASIIGYAPYNDKLQREASIAPFYPDDFVIGLGGMISSNWGGGEEDEDMVKEDIMRTAFCNRNTADLPCLRTSDPKAMKILGIYELKTKSKNLEAPSNLGELKKTKVLVVRVELSAKDTIEEDEWWRLPATQFRMECKNGALYYPVAYLYYDQTKKTWQMTNEPTAKLSLVRPRDVVLNDAGLVIDWVYRILDQDTPESVTFRQTATDKVAGGKELKAFPFGDTKTKLTALNVDTDAARKQRSRNLKNKKKRR